MEPWGLVYQVLGCLSLVYQPLNASIYQHACRRVLRDTGPLLVAFLIGSVATVIGTLVAFKALPLLDLGADGWKVTEQQLSCLLHDS